MSVILGENGGLPTTALATGHLTLSEDGDTLATELYDCSVSNVADIVILLDHSTSMLGIVGNRAKIYEKFYASIGAFIGELPFGARYSLMPYTDSVTARYPEQQTSQEYYRQESKQDSLNCIEAIKSLTFYGNTSVDASLPSAIKKLSASGAPKKIIVLITDDFTLLPDSMGTELFRADIKVFVLEVGKDNAPTNFRLAQKTGGTYYQAADTNLYSFYLKRIADHIKAEHCMLRYTTNKLCPWNTSHTVALTLDYYSTYKTNWHSYIMPHVPSDTIPPSLLLSVPTYTSRLVSVSEPYPCQRGIKTSSTTQLMNFSLYPIERSFPFTVIDSLEVINPSLPAFAHYLAIDSVGNSIEKDVYYFPFEDTTTLQPLLFSSGLIDIGRHDAPIDTTVSLTIINPNSRSVTVSSVQSVGNINEITTSLTPTVFAPFEERAVTIRFSSSLLGNYKAQFTLHSDTSALSSLIIQAQTFGHLHVQIDSSRIGSFGDTGSIVVHFQAKPNPVNMDTIRFSLTYDTDLLEFIPQRISCPTGSSFCRYSIFTNILTGGELEVLLVAPAESFPITIDSSDSYLRLPFRTYLAKNQSSLLTIDDYSISQNSLLTFDAGTLSVDDGCGDEVIRSFLLDKNSLTIINISRSSNGGVTLNFNSTTSEITTITITDILGRMVSSTSVGSNIGENMIFLPQDLASNSYILTIRQSHSSTSVPFAIMR